MLKLDGVVIRNGAFRLPVELEIVRGNKVAVIGPSGAGKSTLIGAIAGFHPLERGEILWNGQRISQCAPGERPVAMLFQDGNLFPHLSISHNIGLGIRPSLNLGCAETARVNAALDRVGLHGFGGRKPAELSGGQQSRAALARVLVQSKPLVLLDEPFAALGPALKAEMLDLVADLTRETGATLLMVSHDPSDARRIADQVVLVEGGRVHPAVETGPMLDNPPPALRDYLGDVT